MSSTSRIESLFFHKGLKCVVLFTDMGHRCGYVGIDPSHPLFGIDYNVDIKSPELLEELKKSDTGKRGIIDIVCWDGESVTPSILFNVHGSITYSGKSQKYPHQQIEPLWWYGFDCGHYRDAKDLETHRKYFVYEKYTYLYESEFGEIRTLSYVEDECKSLAEQLYLVGEILKRTRLQISAGGEAIKKE